MKLEGKSKHIIRTYVPAKSGSRDHGIRVDLDNVARSGRNTDGPEMEMCRECMSVSECPMDSTGTVRRDPEY